MSKAARPNVVFIMADQMKPTSSSLYWSHGCDTPSLERLAQRGILYENAFSPQPLCVPARVSLWCSQFPRSLGSRRNETLMRPGIEHAFFVWKRNGFHAGLIGKNHCFAAGDVARFDTWCEISHLGLPEAAPTRGMEWFRPISGIRRAHSARRARRFGHPSLCWAATDHPLDDYSTGLIAGQT